MTSKPTQHSVAIVNAIRTSINGTIDTLLDSLSVQSDQLEQAFLTELAHLDETYTDQENDDTALELVQRFDKGYAKTMASIQAASERLVEARRRGKLAMFRLPHESPLARKRKICSSFKRLLAPSPNRPATS